MDPTATSFLLSAFVILVPLLDSSHGLDVGEGDDSSEIMKRRESSGPLWFGPRLGKRSEPSDLQDESLLELIKDGPWALVPLKAGGNRVNKVNYTPRLGRESREEDLVLTETSRSPPFAPRLGRRRHNLPFSPRLGRILQPQ